MGSVNLVIPIYDALIACAVVICVGCQCIIGMKLGCDDLQTANDTLRTGWYSPSSPSALPVHSSLSSPRNSFA